MHDVDGRVALVSLQVEIEVPPILDGRRANNDGIGDYGPLAKL
jgi:hypothetical protein